MPLALGGGRQQNGRVKFWASPAPSEGRRWHGARRGQRAWPDAAAAPTGVGGVQCGNRKSR